MNFTRDDIMNKTPLNKELEDFIYTCGKKARDAKSQEDFEAAEKLYLEAWDALPEPKVNYDHADSISVVIAEFYREVGEVEKALRWFQTVKNIYGCSDAPEAFTGFLLGTILYKGGRFDQAFVEFDRLFKKYSERPFQGEDKEYLEFYLNERAKRSVGNGAS